MRHGSNGASGRVPAHQKQGSELKPHTSKKKILVDSSENKDHMVYLHTENWKHGHIKKYHTL